MQDHHYEYETIACPGKQVSEGLKALSKLLGNEIERTSMRKAARSEAERWGWAGATKQLRSYYEDVLDKKQNIAA